AAVRDGLDGSDTGFGFGSAEGGHGGVVAGLVEAALSMGLGRGEQRGDTESERGEAEFSCVHHEPPAVGPTASALNRNGTTDGKDDSSIHWASKASGGRHPAPGGCLAPGVEWPTLPPASGRPATCSEGASCPSSSRAGSSGSSSASPATS